ncbi:MAG: ATP-binding protein [Phycisphaeraceae bacterium]
MVTAGAFAAAWSLLGPTQAWQAAHPLAAAGVAALSLGMAVGLVQHAWSRPARRRLEQTLARLQSLSQTGPPPIDGDRAAPATAADGDDLDRAIAGVLGHMRERQDQLDDRQRELGLYVKLLELERQQLDAAVNAIGDAVLVTDARHTVGLANEAAAKLLNFEPGSAHDQPLHQVVRDAKLVELIREAGELPQGPARRHVEHRVGDGPDATVFDLMLARLNAVAAQAEDATGGVVAVLRDVTRQRQVAEMHSDFVSSVSHELRTPLSSITAYMEMLIDGEAQDDPTRQEFYQIIQSETHRLSRLIDNILCISRIEAGLVEVQTEPLDLCGVLAEAVRLMSSQARAQRVELAEPDSHRPCMVHADHELLLQATVNVLSNAIRYTPAGGRVWTSLRILERTDSVEVSVHDTGAGIEAVDLPFIFDKFYRGSAHKTLAKGTGLGLNLVKHVVETMHGGRMSVSSAPGAGSVFTFRLSMTEKQNSEPLEIGNERMGATNGEPVREARLADEATPGEEATP